LREPELAVDDDQRAGQIGPMDAASPVGAGTIE
jgi:hypothetical protein